jgi:type IV pilus assembly protein PilZ
MAAMAPARTVLVADDTQFVRERFQQALEQGGHRAVTAATPGEIVARLQETTGVDLILLDLRLPHGRGLRLLRTIQAVEPEASVLVFSGTIGSAAEARQLSDLGVAGFVNEYAGTHHILPALAPHLDPERHRRRQSPRVALDIPITWRMDRTIATAVALNIGEGGLAIRSTTPPPVGTTMRLRFRLPRAAQPIETEGVVAWTGRQVGMGVSFTHLSDTQRAAIRDLVQGRFFGNRKA